MVATSITVRQSAEFHHDGYWRICDAHKIATENRSWRRPAIFKREAAKKKALQAKGKHLTNFLIFCLRACGARIGQPFDAFVAYSYFHLKISHLEQCPRSVPKSATTDSPAMHSRSLFRHDDSIRLFNQYSAVYRRTSTLTSRFLSAPALCTPYLDVL